MRPFDVMRLRNSGGASAYNVLLHMDGANGSTTITNSGNNGAAFACVGTAAISTAQSKFGGASFTPGTGRAQSPSAGGVVLGNGNWTMECFVYLNNMPSAAQAILTNWRSGNLGFYIGINASRVPTFFFSATGLAGIFPTESGSGIALNTWTHLAVVREGAFIRVYTGGTQLWSYGSMSTTTIFNASSTPLAVGADGSGTNGIQQFDGFIDEVAVLVGTCKYPGGTAFTPPSAPFA